MGKLKAKQRRALPSSDFAVPSKAPGPGSYPIEDKPHAIDAEARASGKPVEKQVDAAVHRRYPNLGKAAPVKTQYGSPPSSATAGASMARRSHQRRG